MYKRFFSYYQRVNNTVVLNKIIEITVLLINYGANIYEKNEFGASPMSLLRNTLPYILSPEVIEEKRHILMYEYYMYKRWRRKMNFVMVLSNLWKTPDFTETIFIKVFQIKEIGKNICEYL